MSDVRCWLSLWTQTPCDGALIRAHLIPRQVIKRELRSMGRSEAEIERAIADPRCWVPACGGPVGIGGHHGEFDGLRLRVPRSGLPEQLEVFAAEYGLTWLLDRRYGRVGNG